MDNHIQLEKSNLISEIEIKKTEYCSLFPYEYTKEELTYPYVQKRMKRAEELKIEIELLEKKYDKLKNNK